MPRSSGDTVTRITKVQVQQLKFMLLQYFKHENAFLKHVCIAQTATGLDEKLAATISGNAMYYNDLSNLKNNYPEINIGYLCNIQNMLNAIIQKRQ